MRYKLGRWVGNIGDWLMYPHPPSCVYELPNGSLCQYYENAGEGIHGSVEDCDLCKREIGRAEEHHRFVHLNRFVRKWRSIRGRSAT